MCTHTATTVSGSATHASPRHEDGHEPEGSCRNPESERPPLPKRGKASDEQRDVRWSCRVIAPLLGLAIIASLPNSRECAALSTPSSPHASTPGSCVAGQALLRPLPSVGSCQSTDLVPPSWFDHLGGFLRVRGSKILHSDAGRGSSRFRWRTALSARVEFRRILPHESGATLTPTTFPCASFPATLDPSKSILVDSRTASPRPLPSCDFQTLDTARCDQSQLFAEAS